MAQIFYLGKLGDLVGKGTEMRDLPSDVTDTNALRDWLDRACILDGALLEPSVRIALNNEIVSDPSPVSNEDEIAFLPPVGGG